MISFFKNVFINLLELILFITMAAALWLIGSLVLQSYGISIPVNDSLGLSGIVDLGLRLGLAIAIALIIAIALAVGMLAVFIESYRELLFIRTILQDTHNRLVMTDGWLHRLQNKQNEIIESLKEKNE